MISFLQNLLRKPAAKAEAIPTGSAYFDGTLIVIVKSRCWLQGPLYIEDEPHRSFDAAETKQIQEFLVEILCSPVRIDESSRLSVDVEGHKKRLKVRSQKEAVDRFRHVSLRVDGDVFCATPSRRDQKTKSWLADEHILREEKWRVDGRAARLLLEAFSACK